MCCALSLLGERRPALRLPRDDERRILPLLLLLVNSENIIAHDNTMNEHCIRESLCPNINQPVQIGTLKFGSRNLAWFLHMIYKSSYLKLCI